MSTKIKYDEVVISLKYKGKQVWIYNDKIIAGKIPNADKETLKHRLECCTALIDGATEFPTNDGIWKKEKYKKHPKLSSLKNKIKSKETSKQIDEKIQSLRKEWDR